MTMIDPQAPDVALRAPQVVMRLSRMGSFHQSRLSFMRILLRRLKSEAWEFSRAMFDFDARGVGTAVYTATGPNRAYSLVAFGHDLPPTMRSDRVIATAWDATFCMFDGVPDAADIARLRANVPLQEAGRISESELSLSRANRSVRLWDHVVDRLAMGAQPDEDMVRSVGYLMRTTAVYGSGKFGAADRDTIADRPECTGPFEVEMLSVWLTRAFVLDLVEHMARMRAPDSAVPIEPRLRRRFGIGNSTGLGMAPFLINHPVLLNNWIMAREYALARVLSVETAKAQEIARFTDLTERAAINAMEWQSEHPLQREKLGLLRADMETLLTHLEGLDLTRPQAWKTLWDWAQGALSEEGQEQLVSLLLEPYPDLVDGLADCMAADEAAAFRIDGRMDVAQLRDIVARVYAWALEIDWTTPTECARVWYTSQEKLEPRLGERFEEDIAPWEQPLAPGRDAAQLWHDLAGASGSTASFLMAHPEHRHCVRRAQIAARHPYAEICDNTIHAKTLPIDLLRAKLSFFGAGHFDPRSDRWVRINMFRNAPFPHELAASDPDDWTYPQ